MEEAIKQFHTQFEWKPVVTNAEKLRPVKKYIVGGMGGSHLAADLLRAYKPQIDVSVFSDYGIPELSSARLKDSLLIASSFSGNTEEAVDFAEQALAKGLPLAVIAKGGKLLEFAQKNMLPYVELPPTKVQPRSGLGFQMLALVAILRDETLLSELAELASVLQPSELEGRGEELAVSLRGEIPVLYSSTRNQAIAYNWKIKFNETGKIPAFYNVFPELNHNEMTGFDVIETTEGLSRKLHFIFLTDSADHPQNQKRMQVTKKLYEARGLSVTEVPFEGGSALQKMFNSLLVADWTAVHLSKIYGTEADQVPMVEEFKKLIV
ncbi:MAG: hypothetical protein COV91_03055 [Candidatus Taylorbacteria bacterium CG11_big_fil_rev_8_21_14_0_20_46_11]|uniref:SIS domain-containing protein n=1 Tax=Candidatus Taylorbacteria bacterium CG11_big_fil_rev_8_21_14_0_20_46_11 TaxID=1975025 RepID=A0A2H0KDI0_9BACT|nr:MAG: hypothetical protein COV91_03055 [Candidatus Taylorbacteria bacterium CG11_big_fil_rev_8_21_14_0_20_46_11]